MKEIKERILKDLTSKRVRGIGWLQKEYGISYQLAKEIYYDGEEEIAANKLRIIVEKKILSLSKERSDALLKELNNVISHKGALKMIIALKIALYLKKQREYYVVAGNLASSYLAYEIGIHNIDCFEWNIKPEVCHGLNYEYSYTIDFRIAYFSLNKVINHIDKMFKGHLMHIFRHHTNGSTFVCYGERLYVIDNSIRTLAESKADLLDKICINCIDGDLLREENFPYKYIKINVLPSKSVSFANETKKKIEGISLAKGKINKKSVCFNIDTIKKEHPSVLNDLCTYSDELNIEKNMIPDFDSNYMNDLLKEIKPKSYSDLEKVLSISYSSGGWEDNQEILFREGKITVEKLIASRDDVLDYLLEHGVEFQSAFKQMERIRRGQKLNPIPTMLSTADCGVESWFVDVCDNIKYLFPRGQTLQALNFAILNSYFKMHYPLEFYSTCLDYFNLYLYLRGTSIQNKEDEIKEIIKSLKNWLDGMDGDEKYYRGPILVNKIRVLKLLIELKRKKISLIYSDETLSKVDDIVIDYHKNALILVNHKQ